MEIFGNEQFERYVRQMVGEHIDKNILIYNIEPKIPCATLRESFQYIAGLASQFDQVVIFGFCSPGDYFRQSGFRELAALENVLCFLGSKCDYKYLLALLQQA